MNIKQKFQQLKKEGRKAFIAYVPFGFPSIAKTKDILLALQEAGVDIIELGIPFSDPIADGPIIQAATAVALAKGANTKNIISTLKALKPSLKVPLALMTYYNPILQAGVAKFFSQMRQAGACAILTVDLPIDEAHEYRRLAKKYGIETVFFITPVTPKERAKKIIRSASGFLYYISVTGTTGLGKTLSFTSLARHIKQLKLQTELPICVGFGIHTRKQIERVWNFSDGAIVGSGIVKFIADNHSKRNFLNRLKKYVKSLKPD
ncbi:MAG: tryptophan synthase subunit alpha [Candidatus Omnitrophica bacterium]|nr:tryptophan synthase subunit alpha [Candidatus Omnitrophota bacterium]